MPTNLAFVDDPTLWTVNINQMNNMQRKKDILERELATLKTAVSAAEGQKKKALEVASMIVNPGEGPVVQSPTLFPARAATRHFRRVYTISGNAPGDKFSVKVRPALEDFVSYQSAITDYVFAPGHGLMGVLDMHGGLDTSVETYIFDFNVAVGTGTLIAEGCIPTTLGRAQYLWNTATVGTLSSLGVLNQSEKLVNVTIYCLHTGGETAYTYSLPPGERANLGATVTSGVNTWLGIAFKGDVSVSFSDNAAVNTYGTPTTFRFLPDTLIDQGGVERYRVTALSALCSYRGNLLENAGVISAARAPDNWAPRGNDMYDAIAKLPDNSYRGPLINGAYTWWLPGDMEELDFITPGEAKRGTKTSLYLAGEFTDAGSAVELIVDMIVEFYSPLQIFERNPLPPFVDAHVEMLHQLALLPAATCNPSHMEILKKGVKAAARMGLAGYNFAKAHPEYVALLLKGLSMIAA